MPKKTKESTLKNTKIVERKPTKVKAAISKGRTRSVLRPTDASPNVALSFTTKLRKRLGIEGKLSEIEEESRNVQIGVAVYPSEAIAIRAACEKAGVPASHAAREFLLGIVKKQKRKLESA